MTPAWFVGRNATVPFMTGAPRSWEKRRNDRLGQPELLPSRIWAGIFRRVLIQLNDDDMELEVFGFRYEVKF
jgi:hypothetical protein